MDKDLMFRKSELTFETNIKGKQFIIGYLEVTYNVCFVSYKLISKFTECNP